ncbi:MAG: hypothetical protein AAGF26_16980 [Cyanobacteria bacterium P01_G01_bin.49]
MKNLSSHNQPQKQQNLLIEYQTQLSLSLTEINAVIRLLHNQEKVTKSKEKIVLANQMVEQVTQRLETLAEQSQWLQDQHQLSELENYTEVRELMSHKLAEIRETTKQWEYTA